MKFKRIAIDTSKHVFTLHGVDEAERPVLRRELRRGQVAAFFAKQEPTEMVLEACGSAHHWGRQLSALGHRVKLIPPQYVKPFVKRGKNDRNDAEAISEAASRPTMRFVPVKSAEQQAELMVLKVRELVVKQRTQLVNALRGHAAEFGIIAAKGVDNAAGLAARAVADPAVPAAAQEMMALLGGEIAHLDQRLAEFDRRLAALHRTNPMSRLLAEVPGIGPISAVTLALTIDAKAFRSGRHLAAWIGLTPKEHSTGGKHRLGAISREGNERLRQLLVLGATSVIKVVKPGHRYATAWLTDLLERRPRRVAAVALANKMARIVWAMMTNGEAYRQPPATA
jgi:transposase